ncbi:hypothetical protein [Sphingomonas psychrolutea]|uniref:Uncharacterized protein n=1 Tax=Sphingomonas psychrolutea TaxID=1259676 RepID=A0ABQ1GNJ8_9SPHN|nr:hypothetical protein [Sphingomonas psychrolutea]GGA47352.1 hypothetical protein GCM10011395_17040 [Sphingomonas psychrolutea]
MTTTRLAPISAAVMAVLLLLPIAAPAAPKPAAKTATPKAVLVSMKQVTVTIDPAADAKANADKIAAFQSATLGIFSCADVAEIAQSVGASVTDANGVPLTALPPALRETVRTMKLGTATQMFGDRSEGKVRVLVLCARAVER